MGLRADFLSEVLHALRLRPDTLDFVREHVQVDGDLRDITAVQRLTAAFLRLQFPDLHLSGHEFTHYCLEPAKQMRGLIREQLAIMDSEYKPQLATVECTGF